MSHASVPWGLAVSFARRARAVVRSGAWTWRSAARTVRPFYGIVLRELQRLSRQRSRVLSGLARPLLWLFIVGSGVGAVAAGYDATTYRQLMLPGILGMVILFSAMFGALSTAHDREFGVIRLLLIAPIRRSTVVLAKVTSSALVALLQSAVLLVLLPFLGLEPGPARLAALAGAMTLSALALSSVGMFLASRIDSIENFSGVVNFVVFPMFFLSGALYPAQALPRVLRPLVAANPLTYAVDLMKHALFGSALAGRFGPELRVSADLAFLTVTFGVTLGLTVVLFDRGARKARAVVAAG
jgi:ABC-2 type transport system permease protein